ncbi:MAG: MBL fold metallo-hydrolase [Candidatus Ranarchaeia archaeon]
MLFNTKDRDRKECEEIQENLFIIKSNPIISGDCNIYVLKDKQKCIIFDSGSAITVSSTINSLNGLGIQCSDIDRIILTHCHADHSTGIHELKRRNKDIKIWASKFGKEVLEKGIDDIGLWSLLGLDVETTSIDFTLEDGFSFEFSDYKWEVIETPGHTTGCLCFYNSENGILISGDTLFANGGFGRFDFPSGDPDLLKKSLQKLGELELNLILPGHMSIGREKNNHWLKKTIEDEFFF